MSEQTERHPQGYDWRRRFPDAELVLASEGGGLYAAEGEGAWWLISDEGAMVDRVVGEDVGPLTALHRFDDRLCWRQAVIERRHARFQGALARRLRDTIDDAAALIERRAAAARLKTLTEARELQPWFVDALRADPARPSGALSLETGFPPRHDDWPRLGRADIALRAPDVPPVIIELKCGDDLNALGPCAWDLAKVAFLQRMGDISAGYLLAATSAARWERPIRGAELVASGGWRAAGIRSDYADWWRQWERDGYAPQRLPASGALLPIARAALTVGGIPWELRLVRIWTDATGWFDWAPMLPR